MCLVVVSRVAEIAHEYHSMHWFSVFKLFEPLVLCASCAQGSIWLAAMGSFVAARPPWSTGGPQICPGASRCNEVGSLATGADTFTFLMIHYLGKRFLEAFIFILIMLSGSQWLFLVDGLLS